MTPTCFCLRHCVLYCPVERIPLSRDEQPCMREARYHSAATSQTFPSTAGPTQLDPGSLLDSRRGGAATRVGARNGANTLLKQAIANRMKETPLEEEKIVEKMDKNEMEMSRSIVGNAAWYRDDEGRTGFKPREWENLPNQQKDQVKKRKDKMRGDLEGAKVEQIDEELLAERVEEEKKKMEEGEEKKEERKLSKEEKKELKKKEKEDKKREKEEKKREKEEKKRIEKEEKERKKSLTSLDKIEEKEEKKRKKERENDKELGIQEGTMEIEEKKRSKSKERKETVREEEKKQKIEEKDRSRSKEKKPSTTLESPKVSTSRRESTASSKSTDTIRHQPEVLEKKTEKSQPGAGKPPRHPSLEHKNSLLSSPSSSNEEERSRTVSLQQKPKKQTIGDRRDSSMSESSRISGVSHKSVTFNDRVQTHEIERIIISSSEEDDVGVMSDDELSKPDSERRRRLIKMLQEQEEGQVTDSDPDDFEEQERLIEQQLMEQEMLRRHQAMYPVYNLEETTSQDSLYPEETDPDRYLIEDDGSYISLDKLPAAVRRAIIADMGRRLEDEVNMGSMSKLHEENYGQNSPLSQHLPRSASGYLDNNYMVASYQQAMYGAFHPDDRTLPRSSTHPQDSHSVRGEVRESIVRQAIPENKEEEYKAQNVSNEKKELLFNPNEAPLSQEVYRTPRTLGERRQQHNLHESFYDNVPSRTNSLIGVPPSQPETQRRGSDSRVVASVRKEEEETPVPSPPRRESSTSIERRAFFESMNPSIGGIHAQRDLESTPTPSPPRVIVTQAGNNPQRVVITTTTTSMLTNRTEILEKREKNEEEIRRKFLKQFGGKKAPKAEEEDPLDPGPTSGSRESVYSTDSRESVVSEASIRKENFVRRNFNY